MEDPIDQGRSMARPEKRTVRVLRPPRVKKRYVVTRRLRDGARSRTFVARDVRLRLWRAMTLPAVAVMDDEALCERFVSAGKARSSLNHRNLARVVDVGVDRGRPFVVWELAASGNLSHWLRAHGAMPAWMAIDVAIQVCRGVVAARGAGVEHLQIAPRDLFVGDDERIVVSDFEVERPVELDEERRQVTQIGATLFSCLTGRPARELSSMPGALDGLPPRLAEVVRDACGAPERPTLTELARRLEASLDEVPRDGAAAPLGSVPMGFDERAVYSVLPERVDELRDLLDPHEVERVLGAEELEPTAPGEPRSRDSLPSLDELLLDEGAPVVLVPEAPAPIRATRSAPSEAPSRPSPPSPRATSVRDVPPASSRISASRPSSVRSVALAGPSTEPGSGFNMPRPRRQSHGIPLAVTVGLPVVLVVSAIIALVSVL